MLQWDYLKMNNQAEGLVYPAVMCRLINNIARVEDEY